MPRTRTALLCSLFASLAFAQSGPAQSGQGDWLVAGSPDATNDAGGGLFLVDPVQGTSTALTGVTGDLRRATSVLPDPFDPTIWYVGTSGEVKGVPGPANLFEVRAAGGQLLTSRKLNTDTMTADVEIVALQLVGDELLFGSRDRVGRVALKGGATQTVLQFTGTNNHVRFATDGRYLYGNLFDNSGWRAGGGIIRRIDLQNPKTAEMWIQVDQFPTNVRDVWIDSQGRLGTLDKGNFGSPTLRMWDLESKKQLGSVILPFASLGAPMRAAIDPADDSIVVSGEGITFSDPRYAICTVKNFSITKSLYAPATHPLNGVGVRRSPGLVRRGFVCPTTLSPEPWTGANGPANAGNTQYALTLRAPAASAAVLLVGDYRALVPPVALPGTSCELGALPFLTLAALVPSSGELSVPLPLAASFSGARIDTQWVLVDASANSLGLVTTQVGSVQVR